MESKGSKSAGEMLCILRLHPKSNSVSNSEVCSVLYTFDTSQLHEPHVTTGYCIGHLSSDGEGQELITYIQNRVRVYSVCLPYCSVAQSCPPLCNPVDSSTPGFPVLHHLPEFAQTHIH